MKNKGAIFYLSMACFSAHSAVVTQESIITELNNAREYSKIEDVYSSGTIGKDLFKRKLAKCSEGGNIVCTAGLTKIYLSEENFTELIPLLLKESLYNPSSNDDFSSKTRMTGNFLLGECYMYGNGVLQDFDKALKYYKSASVYGDRDSFIRISQLYFNQITMTTNKEDYVKSWINAYAYMKVASSLPGETKIHEHDGKTVINPFKTITQMQELDSFKPHINEADKLASKICSASKGCRQ